MGTVSGHGGGQAPAIEAWIQKHGWHDTLRSRLTKVGFTPPECQRFRNAHHAPDDESTHLREKTE